MLSCGTTLFDKLSIEAKLELLKEAGVFDKLEDLQKSAGDLNNLIKELTERLNTEFKTGVTKINTQFSEFFKLMFGGGVASLEIVREEKKKAKNVDEEDEEATPEAVEPLAKKAKEEEEDDENEFIVAGLEEEVSE